MRAEATEAATIDVRAVPPGPPHVSRLGLCRVARCHRGLRVVLDEQARGHDLARGIPRSGHRVLHRASPRCRRRRRCSPGRSSIVSWRVAAGGTGRLGQPRVAAAAAAGAGSRRTATRARRRDSRRRARPFSGCRRWPKAGAAICLKPPRTGAARWNWTRRISRPPTALALDTERQGGPANDEEAERTLSRLLAQKENLAARLEYVPARGKAWRSDGADSRDLAAERRSRRDGRRTRRSN